MHQYDRSVSEVRRPWWRYPHLCHDARHAISEWAAGMLRQLLTFHGDVSDLSVRLTASSPTCRQYAMFGVRARGQLVGCPAMRGDVAPRPLTLRSAISPGNIKRRYLNTLRSNIFDVPVQEVESSLALVPRPHETGSSPWRGPIGARARQYSRSLSHGASGARRRRFRYPHHRSDQVAPSTADDRRGVGPGKTPASLRSRRPYSQ